MRQSKVSLHSIIQIADELRIMNDGEGLYSNTHLLGMVTSTGGHVMCKDVRSSKFTRFAKRAFPFLRWKLATCTRCKKRHLLWRSPVKYSRWVCGCVEMDWNDYTWNLSEEIDKAQTTLEVGNDQPKVLDGKETANSE